MKLSQIKTYLNDLKQLRFVLPNGSLVPAHFHVTEVGKITKHFIDCGGVLRKEEVINFQLWNADDIDHRLAPKKLKEIIALSEKHLALKDLDIEVEYQETTIGKYGLDFDGNYFVLTQKFTDCLAKDQCGVPEKKSRIQLSTLKNSTNCSPGSGCC